MGKRPGPGGVKGKSRRSKSSLPARPFKSVKKAYRPGYYSTDTEWYRWMKRNSLV